MTNEIIPENWWQRNWKWLLPTFILFGIVALVFAFADGNVTDLAQAYSDQDVVQNAIQKANENPRVNEVLGKLEVADKLAILEGNAVYSDNGQTVNMTVRISGTKGKGKIDILAKKSSDEWHYQTIQIRLKNSDEKIQVLNQPSNVKS